MPATRARAKAVRYLAFLAPQGSEDLDMPTRIILDCDPGIDDALAIAFAHGHPGIELVGITTVAGNVGLARTTANALAVCEFTGAAGTPVTAGGRGCDRRRTRGRCTGIRGWAGRSCRRPRPARPPGTPSTTSSTPWAR